MVNMSSPSWWAGLQVLLALFLCGKLFVSSTRLDASTDAYMMFNRTAKLDSSEHVHHHSLQSWYTDFLHVALQRQSWPIDTYASEEDFEPLFLDFEKAHPKTPPRNLTEDDWAKPFLLEGDSVLDKAVHQADQGNVEEAIKLYMRAANVFRIGYFPWVHTATTRSHNKLMAWQKDKEAFQKAVDLMNHFSAKRFQVKFDETIKDGTSRANGQRRDHTATQGIPLYVCRSHNTTGPEPVVVMITGLDHYHTHTLVQVQTLLSLGFAVVVTPMPGTGDSPITGREPQADKNYWTAIIDWIHSKPVWFDADCVSFWGVSTGSYWAIKASRFEKNRIKRALSEGTASHYTFTREWLEVAETLSYPSSLQTALGRAFGYYDPEDFKANVEQYSLLHQGILDQDGALLIGVNGEDDTTFPIDDQRILLEHGPGALLRWFPNTGHMGEPLSTPWLIEFWRAHSAC